MITTIKHTHIDTLRILISGGVQSANYYNYLCAYISIYITKIRLDWPHIHMYELVMGVHIRVCVCGMTHGSQRENGKPRFELATTDTNTNAV